MGSTSEAHFPSRLMQHKQQEEDRHTMHRTRLLQAAKVDETRRRSRPPPPPQPANPPSAKPRSPPGISAGGPLLRRGGCTRAVQ